MTNAHVPSPTLTLADDTPVSSAFGDVYFSRAGGVAETEHVFLKGNDLPERWVASASAISNACVASHGEPAGQGSAQRRGPGPLQSTNRFTIAELGFGTGLNFLVTLKRFRETAAAGAVLHYIAIEKYPFTPETLRAVLALQPALASEAAELLAAYPLRLPGIHRIHLNACVLTLCVGEVGEMLEELRIEGHLIPPPVGGRLGGGHYGAPEVGDKVMGATPCRMAPPQPSPYGGGGIDAWYLDGFSPAKNPEMWHADILARVGELSGPGTSFATFTSAGEVRRALMAAGFEVRKVPGFGHKREMSVGHIPMVEGAVRSADGPREPEAVGRTKGSGSGGETPPARQRHIIIGAGIAGATLAHAMAERGYNVTVLERGRVASGASGNAAGVLFPQLTKQWNTSTAWYFAAYSYALRQLAQWKAQGLMFASDTPGMLRLPRHEEEEAQLRTLNETLGLDASIVHWLSRDAASAHAGVALQTGAAYFPHGTWISPPELCRALLHHTNITLHEECPASSLTRAGDIWEVTLNGGEVMHASYVCVTSAYDSATLLADYGLRLNTVGGQISELAAGDAAAPLRSILCHKGYVIPRDDSYMLGATYHREDMLAVTPARHAENIEQLEHILPNWPHGGVVGGRSSIRATTPDRMPYVGALDDGLYVSTGHGSRGLLSAPLAAEIITSSIAHEISPVTHTLAKAVNPLRLKKA